MKRLQVLIAAGMVSAAGAAALAGSIDVSKLPPAAQGQTVSYQKDIQPMLEASCVRCHGSERPKAGLRLDSREGVLKGSKDGKVISPGKSEKSRLVLAVSQLDPEIAMPPKPRPGKHREGQAHPEGATGAEGPGPGGPGGHEMGPPPKPLTSEQVGLIRAWIDQGAK